MARIGSLITAILGVSLASGALSSLLPKSESPTVNSSSSQPSATSPTISTNPTITPSKPPSTPQLNRSLDNGAVLVEPYPTGNHSFAVKNGNDRDAVVRLVNPDNKTIVASFYIQKNSESEMKNLPTGNFDILFTAGVDWDNKLQKFTREAGYTKFDRGTEFKVTQREETGSIYQQFSGVSVTLNKVVNGNATTRPMNESEFAQYAQP